jgi:hypothetical protein
MNERQRQAREARRLRATGAIRLDAEAHFVGEMVVPFEPGWHRRHHALARQERKRLLASVPSGNGEETKR